MLHDRDIIEQMYNFDYYDQGQLTETVLRDVWNEKDEYFDSVFLEQAISQQRELWQAVRQDFDEGNIGVHELFGSPSLGGAYPTLQFTWTFETDSRSPESEREGSMSIYRDTIDIAITPQAKHTLACLEEMGLPGAGYQLFDRK